ncbi:MAG: YidC/Oxa1 family insertase periplasmic-domain containing protein [Planctomycetes bacterium]|nr:YidC/Oxa1 family insertase periplasmic-domain containing protein [Planctomycetota bacterium]
MPMLFRFLFSLLLAFGVAAQTPVADKAFTVEFGADGVDGSLRARFSREGAGLVWLQAKDHYVTVAAKQKAEHGPGDWLLLTANGQDHALRLANTSPVALPVDPAMALWNAETTADSVRFWLPLGNGLVLEKVLRHDAKNRGFQLELAVKNESGDAGQPLSLQLLGPVPAETAGGFFSTAHAIAAPREGDSKFTSPASGASALEVDPRQLSFAGSTSRFFAAFLAPKDDAARSVLTRFDVDPMPLQEDGDSGTHARASTRVRFGLSLPVPAPGQETRVAFDYYFGPKSYRVFDTLSDPLRYQPILDVDLNSPCCGIDVPGGRPMAKLLLWLLGIFHDFLGNWGLAIITLTILVRGLLAPLNFRMQKQMRGYSARMAKLKPKLDELKTRFADDKAGYQQAMIQFQREHKLIPPIGGCLPIFLTMPVYIGLFTALRTAYDLRQQPFVSWINDLSIADHLLTLPFWPGALNLLPLLWIGLMVWMTFRQPLPTDPQQRSTMQIMRFMPLMFGVMLYQYASGLTVYMVTSVLWSLVESTITKKVLGPIDPNVAAMTPTPI